MAAPGGFPQHGEHERPEGLATRIDELASRLEQMEMRLAALEGNPRPVAPGPAITTTSAPGSAVRPAPLTLLALAGRLCLIFAGAYLVRSLTDAGAVPKGVGVLLGLAYAGFWAVMSDRAARKGKSAEAAVVLVSAALIGFPLLWEATVGFKVLPATAAAILLVLLTAALIGVAWRGSMQGAAWIITFTALVTGFALMVATAALEGFSVAFLVIGGGVLWLTYGRRWQGLRWPSALAADASILIVALLAAWPGGPPEAYRSLGTGTAMGLALGLVLVYLGSFVVRILMKNRELIVFEGVQGALALLVGFGGALHIAQATGSGALPLGIAALLAGFACYAAAFAFVEKQSEGGGNFVFFTSLALALVAAGCLILIPGGGRTWAFVALGLLATLLGLRHQRWSLLAHGAVYLTSAALASELASRSAEAFLLASGQPRTPSTIPLLLTLVALAFTHARLSRSGEGLAWPKRLPSFVAGLWAALGMGAMAVAGLTRLLPGSPPEAAAIAAVRTAVLAGAAACLAAFARAWPGTELRWLVYPLLGLSALKLLVSDLPMGRPLTLFPALAVFGAALILAPRLLRAKGIADTDAEGF